MQLHLHERIKKLFPAKEILSVFEDFMALQGECVRAQAGRVTHRIALGNKTYYIKQHTGVGWREILKNILQLRLPVISAKNEWLAIKKLGNYKILGPSIFAYGLSGRNPARQRSFILTEELAPTISLEDLTRQWQSNPPSYGFKQALITEVARIAHVLHKNGMNHRDFYLCHFLLDTSKIFNEQTKFCKIYLIDLHRAQVRPRTPLRWIIKDLASLYFSSRDIGLTQRDLYRFMKIYRANSLPNIIQTEKDFWHKVVKRGERLYRNNRGREL